jgi:hypothetical protein
VVHIRPCDFANTEDEVTPREAERRARHSAADHAHNGSMTVDEWCAYRRLSRSMAYKLWAEGFGPATYYVGTKRLISSEADAAWLAEREAEATEPLTSSATEAA